MAKFYSASIKDPFKTAKAIHGKKTIYIDLPNDQKKLREQHTIKCGHDIINRAIQASELVFDDFIDRPIPEIIQRLNQLGADVPMRKGDWKRTDEDKNFPGQMVYTPAMVFTDLYNRMTQNQPRKQERYDLPEAICSRWNDFFVGVCDWTDFEFEHVNDPPPANNFNDIFKSKQGSL
jgi:hypothetical protein